MVCLECGGRNQDLARRCGRCGIRFDAGHETPGHADPSWEYAELAVDLPGLRWFQLPSTWIPLIADQLRQAYQNGWQAVHDLSVPELVSVGSFRRDGVTVDRAAVADSVVLTLRRQRP